MRALAATPDRNAGGRNDAINFTFPRDVKPFTSEIAGIHYTDRESLSKEAFNVVTSQPEPRNSRDRLGSDRTDPDLAGAGAARVGGRFHRLRELVIRGRVRGILSRKQSSGARIQSSPELRTGGSVR